MSQLTLAAAVLLSGTVFADRNPRASKNDIRQHTRAIERVDAAHSAAMKDLADKEKAAKRSIVDDKALTASQREEKTAEIAGDFAAQRQALDKKFRDDKRELEKDVKRQRRGASEKS